MEYTLKCRNHSLSVHKHFCVLPAPPAVATFAPEEKQKAMKTFITSIALMILLTAIPPDRNTRRGPGHHRHRKGDRHPPGTRAVRIGSAPQPARLGRRSRKHDRRRRRLLSQCSRGQQLSAHGIIHRLPATRASLRNVLRPRGHNPRRRCADA